MTEELFQSNYPSLQEGLLMKIKEAIDAEKVFILAVSLTKQHVLSVFNREQSSMLCVARLLVLVVCNDEETLLHDKESHIEKSCSELAEVTVIVVRMRQLNEWSLAGHPFVHPILRKAIVIFEKEKAACDDVLLKDGNFNKEKLLAATINRSEEFLAGADLFHLRKQNAMAAFMLHQAAEQCLRVLLEITTGYYCNTHSIARLLRINTFLYPCLSAIFPQHSEKNKIRMQLLQKAYIDTRYKEDYCIHQQNLIVLTERVTRLKELLKEEGRRLCQATGLSSNQTKESN